MKLSETDIETFNFYYKKILNSREIPDFQTEYYDISEYMFGLINNKNFIFLDKLLSVENIKNYDSLFILGLTRSTRDLDGLYNWKIFREEAERELERRGQLQPMMFMGL